MKLKSLLLLAVILLTATVGYADVDVSANAPRSKQGTLAATDTAGSVTVDANHLALFNDGANEVYLKLNSSAAATTSDFKLLSGEAIAFDATPGKRLVVVKYICAAAETASVRYLAWE